jgi:hypothetical protein
MRDNLNTTGNADVYDTRAIIEAMDALRAAVETASARIHLDLAHIADSVDALREGRA